MLRRSCCAPPTSVHSSLSPGSAPTVSLIILATIRVLRHRERPLFSSSEMSRRRGSCQHLPTVATVAVGVFWETLVPIADGSGEKVGWWVWRT
ncbi:hypothetical protein V6N13_061949 [Hibiscus sabdariffa]